METQDRSDEIDAPLAPLRRLMDQKWVLIIGAVGLGALWLRDQIGLATAAAFYAAIVLAAASEPERERRKRQTAAIKAMQRAERESVWPDSSTKRIVASLSAPSVLIDREGIIRLSNTKANEQIKRLIEGDALTLHFRQREFGTALEQVLDHNRAETIVFAEKVPVERWYRAAMTPVRFESDETAKFVLVEFHDLTEQRRTERMRVDFIANASHELRTPLASLSGFVETLMGPAKDDEQARGRFLIIMREQAERMSRLIDDLLSLSRIEMRVHVRPTDVVNLSDLAQRTLESLRPLAQNYKVTLNAKMATQEVMVTGDEDELTQVLSNLIENAIKYGGGGGKVDVSTTVNTSQGSAVTVRDFGPGIEAEHLPRLTERFYRVNIESSREKKGTGLGLAIVKHILNRHGAQLDVKSVPGQGASFTVLFPPV